jgi:hypothetical protein
MRLISRASMDGLEMPVMETKKNAPRSEGARQARVSASQSDF